jgi:hypothetical protein
VLDAADLIADEVLDGGPGDDQAWHDEEDQPAGIEARLFR